MKHIRLSTITTTVFVILVIPITVVAARYQTSNQSNASSIRPIIPSTPPPTFIPSVALFPPTIAPFDFETVYQSFLFTALIDVIDKDADDILQLTITGLPTGIELIGCQPRPNLTDTTAITCTIHGKPEQAGQFSLTFIATDKMGNVGTYTRNLTVKKWHERFLHL